MLRAADSDREQVADCLRDATVEGRLLAEELEQRLTAAFSARTYGELDAVVADLPAPREGRGGARRQVWFRATVAVAIVLAVLTVLAAVALVITGVIAAWVLWIAAGWLFFGHRRRACYARRRAHSL